MAPYSQALMALLVSVAPNLKSMALCPLGWEDKAALSKLRGLKFLPDSDDSGHLGSRSYISYDIFDPLDLVRNLPALRNVSFNAITDYHSEDDPIPASSANYKSISIRHSMSPEALCGAIESAKPLEELVYSIGGRGTLKRLDINLDADLYLEEIYKQTGRDSVFADPTGCTLNCFTQLKHLALGVHSLYYYPSGIDKDHSLIHSMADGMPPNLESLRPYGYRKDLGSVRRWNPSQINIDAHVSRLMEEKDTKLPSLKSIEGLEGCIPNAETIEDLDSHPELIWKRPEGQWPVYEY
ncbi:hypothetical protein BJY01DRAFT_242927 [Aspergillus pseudoustus]|uniref:Uncharacterized protein n=1 Tax=Aspergillus pseudoustus TaxID=1810923 RepID=A0ABR4KXJ8_9EURO